MPLKFKVANGKGGIISSGVCHPAKNFTLFFSFRGGLLVVVVGVRFVHDFGSRVPPNG